MLDITSYEAFVRGNGKGGWELVRTAPSAMKVLSLRNAMRLAGCKHDARYVGCFTCQRGLKQGGL